MFEREYRELSTVPRWTIIRTIQKQNVAEHSFYVALYAGQVADLIKWPGPRAVLLDIALRHDLEEVYMSDIPGPSKRAMVHDVDKYQQRCESENVRRFGEDYKNRTMMFWNLPDVEDQVRAIIKVADLLDECFFLATDHQLGNRSTQMVFEKSLMRLQGAVEKLPLTGSVTSVVVFKAFNDAIYAHGNEYSKLPIG